MAKNEMTAVDRRRGQMRKTLRDMLAKGRDRYAAVLPRHLTPERMANLALTASTLNPKLLDCSPESVCLALLCASQTGIEPDGYHGHLIPYGTQCTFVPDFKGLIQLALNNGVVVDAQAVYENDEFVYELGSTPRIVHRPAIDEERGELRCAYAIAHFKDGRSKFIVATKSDIAKRRNVSAAKNKADSPWQQWPEMMAVKTSVKMLSKYLPRSPEMTAATAADDAAELGIQQQPTSIPGQLPHPSIPSRTDALVQHTLGEPPGPEPDPSKDPVAVFSEALENLDTPEEVDSLFQVMIEKNAGQLSDQAYSDACEARDVRKAVLTGELT